MWAGLSERESAGGREREKAGCVRLARVLAFPRSRAQMKAVNPES
jgi:hypothetical protein